MNSSYTLNWKKLDPEAKFGLKTKKFTGVNGIVSFILGAVYTLIFYLLLYPVKYFVSSQFIDMFFHGGAENRSYIPYATVLLTMWCMAILIQKQKKISIQRMAVNVEILPDDPGFILSPDNSSTILKRIEEQVYMASGFIALNRIQKTLANLKNIGRVSDVSSVLNDFAIADEKYTEGTYTVVKGLIWAIPVTGFVGTVLGLSDAVGGFGQVISQGVDIEIMKNSLSGVTSGLAVAFETTLIALVAALFLQLYMTIIMQKEEDLMNECADYCYRNVVARLKMIDTGE